MQPLLTPQQAAELLAVSTRHLRYITSAGLIRYVNVGMRDRETRRYRMADIEAYVESNLRSGGIAAALRTGRKSRSDIDPYPVTDFTKLLEEKQQKMRERSEKLARKRRGEA